MMSIRCKICGGLIYGISDTTDVRECTCQKQEPINELMIGWQCPVCKQVYSPYVMKCSYCQPRTYSGTTVG